MELAYQYVWLIPVYPLIAAFVVGVAILTANRWIRSIRKVASGFCVFSIGTAMAHAIAIFIDQLKGGEAFRQTFTWGQAGDFVLRMGFGVDHLAAMMLVVVTTVAFLVMVYTDGYMEHDEGYVRFYSYLSLFSFSMLGLVLSPNLLQIYVFWELVGVCSYLLIGFWYDRPSAAEAAQKAFVTNRVGDFGLLLGMLGLYWVSRTFEFEAMGQAVERAVESGSVSAGLITLFSILVFLGPMAKSAQFPLHVWLPDAMEGPTPISALIHAATMVAAGVFLVARMFPVFEGVPVTMQTISWIGAATAFLGASIAMTQNDIKKGLAYSTISQLGYMIMAMGVGAYGAGLFHLMTHAYFKAMLFLCSGSVIHGMEGVVGHNPAIAQDMRVMGGLRKYMPITATTFLIGTLAICGIPPFAGFWSKDEILGSTFAVNPALWFIGFLTAGITAFYMFRMYFLTFEGEFRGNDAELCAQVVVSEGTPVPAYSPAFGTFNAAVMNPVAQGSEQDGHENGHGLQPHAHAHDDHAHEPHESPWTMTLPLATLAVPSILIGLTGTPFANFFEAFIHPPSEIVDGSAIAVGLEEWAEVGQFEWSEFLLMGGSSVGIGLIGITLAVMMYRTCTIDPAAIAAKIKGLYFFSLNKWNIDELYHNVFVKGTRFAAREALEVDQRIVDGVVNFTGLATMLSGESLKYFESGKAQFYALVVFASAIAIVVVSGSGVF
ncbi:MAG: NAD(P)H-quinone oxidoreductase subunit 5 [Cyanobacteria bacterium P01_E01_bin.45]